MLWRSVVLLWLLYAESLLLRSLYIRDPFAAYIDEYIRIRPGEVIAGELAMLALCATITLLLRLAFRSTYLVLEFAFGSLLLVFLAYLVKTHVFGT
jgi:hypothetical protein